ncbi:MAG: DUF1385 domain-containing protein [Fimbriimonadaceae bacterium]
MLRTEAIEKTWIGRQKWLKLPFLRGSLAILDSMALGLRSMRFASNIQISEEFQDENAEVQPGKELKPMSKKMQEGVILTTMVVSLALGLFIFQYLPNLISAGIAGNRMIEASYTVPTSVTAAVVQDRLAKAGVVAEVKDVVAGQISLSYRITGDYTKLTESETATKLAETAGLKLSDQTAFKKTGAPDWRINLVTEIIKIVFFIGYIWLISRMPEIQRVFQYHGAEHKAINTLEANEELSIENCKAQTRLHPRCGTSFAVIVLLVSLVIFTFVPRVQGLSIVISSVVRFLIEVPLLLVVAGISYELIRIAGKFRSQKWVGYLFWPGLMTQNITTSEPDESQIRVALESLKATIQAEKSGSAPDETLILA